MIYVYMTLAAMLMVGMSEYVNTLKTQGDLSAKITSVITSRILYFIGFLIIFVPGAIRYYVGIDYTTYSNYQIPMVLSGNTVKVEFLYKVVIKLGYWLSGFTSYQMIFVITNFIIVLFLFMYIKDQSNNMWLSIAIFMSAGFFYFSLSGMRQAIGVTIAMWALKFIKQKKFWHYAIWISIAALFHTAAIVYIVFYFVDKVKISPYIILAVMIFIRIFATHIRDVIIAISSKLGIYSEYFGGKFDVAGLYSRTLPGMVLFIILFLCFTRSFLGKEDFYKNQIEVNVHYVACMVISMINFLPTPTRILYLFIPIYITLIPNTISLYKNKNIRLLLYLGTIVVLIFLMYELLFVQNSYEVLPYRFIWKGRVY